MSCDDLSDTRRRLGPEAWLLRGEALDCAPALLATIGMVLAVSPLRRLRNPNGSWMDVAVSSCGAVGWENSGRGYGYLAIDPTQGRPWPTMPELFRAVANRASEAVGFGPFDPAVCIINRYAIGAGLRMHQDRNDAQDDAPVVSVSLGLPAVFRLGGQGRGHPVRRVMLTHGDIAVWGGVSRMVRHAIEPIAPGHHPATGACRLNLTFRSVKLAVSR